jgi:hypothetical protein
MEVTLSGDKRRRDGHVSNQRKVMRKVGFALLAFVRYDFLLTAPFKKAKRKWDRIPILLLVLWVFSSLGLGIVRRVNARFLVY